MANELLETLDKLVKLHEGLLTVTERKAVILKERDTDSLQKLLKQEKTYITAINTVEQQRQKEACQLLQKAGQSIDTPTLDQCIDAVSDPSLKDKLQQKKDELLIVIKALSQKNELNQELTYQSLQFVNMTMELIMPKKNTMNYSNKQGTPNQARPNRSIFDLRT